LGKRAKIIDPHPIGAADEPLELVELLERLKTKPARLSEEFTQATRQHQRLFVLAISAATQNAWEQLRLRRSNGISCDRDRCGRYQNSMPNNACSKYGVASDCDAKTNCPHEPQRLKHIMPYRNIRNITKRTYFSIKYEVPSVYDELSHLALPLNNSNKFVVRPNDYFGDNDERPPYGSLSTTGSS
jgi:hypothetical protein